MFTNIIAIIPAVAVNTLEQTIVNKNNQEPVDSVLLTDAGYGYGDKGRTLSFVARLGGRWTFENGCLHLALVRRASMFEWSI